MLIGKTGSGKSSTGNTILNDKVFKTSSSGSSITSCCVSRHATRFGKNIQVVDTPGTFDTSSPNEMVQREIVKCIGITSPGPHCFLLIMGLSRFTQEDEESINHFVNYFGKDVFRYFAVLFTRKDDLEYEGLTLDDHLQTIPQNLRTIIAKCGGRCIAFNNRAKGPALDDQVKDLLEIINCVIRQNQGACYTNEMYVEAEKVIKARQCEIEKERNSKRDTERQKIEQEIEQNYKYQYGLEFQTQNTITQHEARLDSKLQEVRTNISSEKELEMQKEIKELKLEIRCMKEQFEKIQIEKDMTLQRSLEQLDQKYEQLLDARLVARDEVENGYDIVVDTLTKVVLGVGMRVGNVVFSKLFPE